MLSRFCPARFGVLQCGARLSIHTLNFLDRVVSGASFFNYRVCLSLTLLIVDLLQYYACCTRSGVTRCTLFMLPYLRRMCQCGLYAVLRSHIDTLMRLHAAEPRSTAENLLLCQNLCVTILVTPYLMGLDWRSPRAGPMPFYLPSCSLPFCILLFSPSLRSFYVLVLSGRGLSTDTVLIALSQPRIANLV